MGTREAERITVFLKKVTNPILLIISAVIMSIGCFLPWATQLFGLVKTNGMDADGPFILALGIILIVIGLYLAPEKNKRWAYIVALVISCISLLVSIIDIIDIGGTDGATIEYGIVICVIGAALAFVFSLRGVLTKVKETEIDHGNRHSTPKMTNEPETTEGE